MRNRKVSLLIEIAVIGGIESVFILEIDRREKWLKDYEIYQQELIYQKQLEKNYDHLQQKYKRCSALLDNKRLLQEQIQETIRQINQEIDDLQTNTNHCKQVSFTSLK